MVGWHVQNCCCCHLEMGCYVVAALDLLLSVAGVIYGSFDMATVSEIERHRSGKYRVSQVLADWLWADLNFG